jgi:molybdopterin synthase catalytic subunit
MITKVLLTRDTLAEALQRCDPFWCADPCATAPADPEISGSAGAVLDFRGVVREDEDGVALLALDYEAHEPMAVHQIEQILERLGREYPLLAALVMHRIGRVPVGEASLLMRLWAPHRGEALRACAEFIDELKRLVPIWKHPVPR